MVYETLCTEKLRSFFIAGCSNCTRCSYCDHCLHASVSLLHSFSWHRGASAAERIEVLLGMEILAEPRNIVGLY